MSKPKLFTIGHSNRTIDEFVGLLRSNGITAVADVRSQPYSRNCFHFNREYLHGSLSEYGIAYVFMGKELGARREEECCFVQGQVKYELVMATSAFQAGLDRIRMGVSAHLIAMMCAEKDPVTCHRTILVAKALRSSCDIQHIVSADAIESHSEAEKRLLQMWQLNENDLFQSREELLEEAYRRQADRIAYAKKEHPTVRGGGKGND